MTVGVTITLLVLAGLAAACGNEPADPGAGASPDGGPATVSLYVSNQSFDDDPVSITVTIDGEVVVDDAFRVENQHTWIEFPLALAPGPHEVVARSDTGVEFGGELVVPEDDYLWAVLDYWYYPNDLDRSFSLRSQTEPIGFD